MQAHTRTRGRANVSWYQAEDLPSGYRLSDSSAEAIGFTVISVTLFLCCVTLFLPLWYLDHSCTVRSQYLDGTQLESDADGFQAVNATMHSLQKHRCDWPWQRCWAFGEVQPQQSGWLEGNYTYRWDGVPYAGGRLASATVRGHLSQYDRLKRALDSGGNVTAWVDPGDPTIAVLDRMHYIAHAAPWATGTSFCDDAITVAQGLLAAFGVLVLACCMHVNGWFRPLLLLVH